MKNQRKALFLGLGAVLLWSTIASAFKLSLRYFSPIELLFYSSFFAVMLLGGILIYQGRLYRAFQCRQQEYFLSIILGLLNPFLYYLVLLKAYDLLPAQQAQPINYTWAITLSLLAVPLLKQKIGWPQWLALLISYCGVVLISTEGHPFSLHFTNPLGVALALCSTVIWALYWIFSTRDSRDPISGLFLNTLCSLPFILAYYLTTASFKIPPLNGLLGAAYIGIVEMGICFVLWLMAMKLTNNTARLSNLIFLSPFLSLLLIHLLLGEQILVSTFGGLLLIVLGLCCQQIKSR
jgi:drug/metabolite transporter (DMT)-like permease